MKKIMSKEEVEQYFLKIFNLSHISDGICDHRAATRRIANHFIYNGLTRENDDERKILCLMFRLLVPNWPKSSKVPGQLASLDDVREDKTSPFYNYGRVIHNFLKMWSDLANELKQEG